MCLAGALFPWTLPPNCIQPCNPSHLAVWSVLQIVNIAGRMAWHGIRFAPATWYLLFSHGTYVTHCRSLIFVLFVFVVFFSLSLSIYSKIFHKYSRRMQHGRRTRKTPSYKHLGLGNHGSLRVYRNSSHRPNHWTWTEPKTKQKEVK